MSDQNLFTLRDLAQHFRRCGLTMTWLRREAMAGRIPCFKAGRRLLFDREAVERELIARAQQGKGNPDDSE